MDYKQNPEAMDSVSNKILGLFQKLQSNEKVTASDITDMLITPMCKIMEDKDVEADNKEEPKTLEAPKVEAEAIAPAGGKNPFSDYKNMM